MEYLYSFMLDSTFIILPNIEIIYFLLLAFRNHNHEKDFFCLKLSPEQNQVGIYVTFKRATSLPWRKSEMRTSSVDRFLVPQMN